MAGRARSHIPQSAEELTPAWFNLVPFAEVAGASVLRVETERVGAGIGFVGDLFRCRLTWDRELPGLPATVVAKVPSSVRQNRALGEGLLAYEREIVVYRELRDTLTIPMPGYFHGQLDPNPAPWLTEVIRWLLDRLPLGEVSWLVDRLLDLPESTMRRFLLVIEDVPDARPASQVGGGSVQDAEAALDVLARFHAAHWMCTELVEDQPLVWPFDRTPKVFQAGYRRNRDEFLERFGELLGPAIIDRLDAVQEQIPELVERLAAPPWTLLHGDYRLDNVLFRPNGDIVVVDYQLLLYGRPGWDVAYFVTTALDPAHRDDEQRLLGHYHDELVARGVTGYGPAELAGDVEVAKDLLAHRMVGTGDVIDTRVEGRDESFVDLMVHRLAGWVGA